MQNQFHPTETIQETPPCAAPSVTLETGETTETLPDTQAVTEMLAHAQRKALRHKRKFWTAFAVVEASGLLPLIFGLLPDRLRYSPFLSSYFAVGLPVALVGGVMMIVLVFRPVKIDSEALMKLGGKQAIPTLLDALTLPATTRYRKHILRTLTALLPQMQASDATLLTPRHRRIFNLWLTHAFNPAWFRGIETEFLLALLKACEQAGDAKAIPVVERLASRTPRNAHQRAIQQAAIECLPLLRAHAGSMDTTQTLLRASMPDTNTPDTLLRAATAYEMAHGDELLRAATPNDMPPTS